MFGHNFCKIFALIFILMPFTGIPRVNPNSLYKTYQHLPLLNVKLVKENFAHRSHVFSDELLQVYVLLVYNFCGASVLIKQLLHVVPVFTASIFLCADDQKPLYHPIKFCLFIFIRRFHKIFCMRSLVLSWMLSWNWLWNMNMEKINNWLIGYKKVFTLWWLKLFYNYCYGSKYLSILKFSNVIQRLYGYLKHYHRVNME